MSRYIDADALKAFIKDQYFQCDMPEEWGSGVMWATSQINHYCNKAPSIDIEPKRGEWKIEETKSVWGKGYMLTCSECGDTFRVTENALSHEHFCRNCGADMREREGE